jgi:hypothetical protein
VLLLSIGTIVAVATLAVVILTAIALESSASLADRLAAVGDVLVGATLFFAIIAALLALLAYAVSTGPPDLQLKVRFEFSQANSPTFKADLLTDGRLKAQKFKQTSATVWLRNNSGYAAKNPAIIIRLEAMTFLPRTKPVDWVIVDFINTNGVAAVQWDGGSTYSIHGRSTRRLPILDMDELCAIPDWGTPALIIEILADNYRKEVVLPVDFVVNGQSHFSQKYSTPSQEWM